ncbi:hypothetical protein ACW0JT_01505 [Arthrobacter sp. SA17]
MKNKTTAWILAALVIGIAGGLLAHGLLPEGPAMDSSPSLTR